MITYSIEDFEEKTGDVSSAWLFGFNHKGTNLSNPNYIIGFVNSKSPRIILHGERKILEKEKRSKYYDRYIEDSSSIVDLSKKLQEKFGGKIEPSQSSTTFSFDKGSIENPEIQKDSEKGIVKVQEIAKLLTFIIDELPIEEYYINAHPYS